MQPNPPHKYPSEKTIQMFEKNTEFHVKFVEYTKELIGLMKWIIRLLGAIIFILILALF